MISKAFLYLIVSLLSTHSFSQQVTNVVLVGPTGVTEDYKVATSFIAIKKYSDTLFQRLDYKIEGPLRKVRSFKDQDLKILNGRYFEYTTTGEIATAGTYINNVKQGDWKTYDDTGKILTYLKYAKDSLVEFMDLDKKDSSITYPDEKEASFPGGNSAWVNYLGKELMKDNPADKSFHGGTVIVSFVIGIDGSVEESFVSKSVEYILDETSLQIISAAPKWKPAFQNGAHVRAYRKQPLIFN